MPCGSCGQPKAERTIFRRDIVFRHCPHCLTDTWQVGPLPEGDLMYANVGCLQCIADGGTCCSLEAFNRWRP